MCRSVSVKCYLPANKGMPYTSAAAAPGWWARSGTICGAFLTDYAPCKVRNLSNSTVQKRDIVGNDPCVVPCRSNVTYRLTKERLTQVRSPHSAPNFHLPNQPKTSPVTPPLIKNETKFLPLSGGVTGEVLGGCGRFGGRGTPLSRGVPLPPRSFPYLTPHSSRKGAKEG